MGFAPCKAEQPLQGILLEEKEEKEEKGYRIQFHFTKYN